jgi:hypothetical protein
VLLCFLRSFRKNESSAVSTQADPRFSYSFGEEGFCVCVYCHRCTGGRLHDPNVELFETICQIRGDDLDSAGTHKRVHRTQGEDTPDGQVLDASSVASSSSLFRISASPRDGNSLTLTRCRTSLVIIVPTHLAPRCCIHFVQTCASCTSRSKTEQPHFAVSLFLRVFVF